jgi:hypothetical protein
MEILKTETSKGGDDFLSIKYFPETISLLGSMVALLSTQEHQP